MDGLNVSDSEEVHVQNEDVDSLDIMSTSHKGEKLRSYTAKFKIEAVKYTEEYTISASAKKFKSIVTLYAIGKRKKMKFMH